MPADNILKQFYYFAQKMFWHFILIILHRKCFDISYNFVSFEWNVKLFSIQKKKKNEKNIITL